MAYSGNKRSDRARRQSIERRQARACKHHAPNALTRAGRERAQVR